MSVAIPDLAVEEFQTAYRTQRKFERRRESNDLEVRFKRLVETWKEECPPSSRIEKLVMQPSYQQIIGMGPAAIPLILRELNESPDHWFWALQSIAGENPVQSANRGNLRAMIEDWNEWAKNHELEWVQQ